MNTTHLDTCLFKKKKYSICEIQGCTAAVIDLSCPKEVGNNDSAIGFCSKHWWEHCDKVIWDPFLPRCLNALCDVCKVNLTTRQGYDAHFLIKQVQSMENAPKSKKKSIF